MNTVTGTNIRFAQFNASLNRNADGQLINDLSNPIVPDSRAIGDATNPNRNQVLRVQQAKNTAEIIQRNNPDVLLINEFDFNTANPNKAVELFINNFLKVGQNGAAPVDYKYFYIAPSNTGISSGLDLNNNGSVVSTLTDGIGDNGYGDDAFGFGNFPGQFGMVVLSKYEIDTPNVRTFQNFLWKDMPGGLLTNDPTVDNPATPVNENLNGFYSAAEIEKLRLSSKSHWDVPIKVNGTLVHVLVSHPTPPVFDGTEDRNGKRNADEIRFWADYVSPGQGGYIYDDKGGKGGIASASSFAIVGDQNADPRDGDSYENAIGQLLSNPNINTSSTPTSAGGPQQATLQGLNNNNQTGNPAFDTADFADNGTNPGNLRTDYVLPSADLRINNSGVFWPLNTDPTFAPVGVFSATLPGGYPASDHRLVFADVQVSVTPSGKSVFPNGVASGDTTQTSTVLWTRSIVPGQVTFEYSTKADFSSIAGTKTATVTDPLKPVKVDVTGLSANTQYYYRAIDINGTKIAGKFSTAAALGQQAGLKFGVSGDWRGELAPYPAISNADTANLKFFIELGDTVYADVVSPAVKNPDGTEKAQATTLNEFRSKNAEVYASRFGQNTWGDLRAATSILATIDDHEVTNDFAGGESLATASAAEQALYGAKTGLINDSPLYENGLQAFQEYNPIRDLTYNTPGDARTDGERKIYRANSFGNDAATFVLDARSFRDKELPDVTNLNDQAQVGKFLVDAFDPQRTMLGKQQIADLKRDLLQSQTDGVTWKFIMVPEPIQNIGVLAAADRFEGYAAERTEILKYVNDNKIENVVFVAADIHGTLVNNLTYQNAPGQAQIATSAFEITTGSVGYSQPFGQTVAQLGTALGVITPAQKAFYDSLPIAGKDTFIKGVVDGGLQPFGYDPLGLDKNLSQANGLINAKLLQGDYVATHVYGWTEFDIDKQTQKLTVTTYGIDPYTRAELEANPDAITSRVPKIVSKFEVTPNNVAPTLVAGTAGADNLIAAITPGFDGFNDRVFTGSGNDSVDVPLAQPPGTGIAGAASGDNRIDSGSGNDTIFVGNGDRSFGGTGDDIFEANDAKDYRISAGAGNDTLFLGTNGRALGGDGNDKLFVGSGGNNFLSGGAGADQFWIANAEIPSAANTILDFQIGTDVIGIQGVYSLGINATTLKLTQVGADTNINFGTQTLAILTGIQTTSLNTNNSSQFVFG